MKINISASTLYEIYRKKMYKMMDANANKCKSLEHLNLALKIYYLFYNHNN